MTRMKFLRPLSLALALALPACDAPGQTATQDTGKTATAPAPKRAPDPPVSAPKPAEPPSPDSPAGKVQLAAVVAREISAAPELADEILGKHGLDRDRFDAIVYEIAADPELTKAYMAARRRD